MSDQIISWIDTRIEAILSYPQSFGSDEAIEMQILSLLEFRAVTINPERELENFGRVIELYQKYIANAFPQAGILLLFQIVKTDNLGYNLATELRKAVEFMKGK